MIYNMNPIGSKSPSVPNFAGTPAKNSFSANKILLGLIVLLIIAIGIVSYVVILRKPVTKLVPAKISGSVTKCGITVGPPIADNAPVGNSYSIEFPITNTTGSQATIQTKEERYACSKVGTGSCGNGSAPNGSEYKTYTLSASGAQKTQVIKLTAVQPAGACGSFQLDVYLTSVNGDGSCNTRTPPVPVWGYNEYPNKACQAPSPSRTPTPTKPAATNTPTPTQPGATNTPTPTATIGPSTTPTPTGTPGPSPTPTVTPRGPTATPTGTPGPTATNTPGSTATPVPAACASKACDNTTNPCASGLICIQANDGSNYCSFPEFQTVCKQNPSQTSCCTASGNSPTPTEIVLAKNTATPGPSSTAAPTVTQIPSAGVATYGQIFVIVSLGIVLLGLIL